MQLCLFYSLAHCVCDARLYTENEYKRSISEFEAGLWFRTTDDGNGDDTEKNTRKINELWTITHALPPEHNMANTREKTWLTWMIRNPLFSVSVYAKNRRAFALQSE